MENFLPKESYQPITDEFLAKNTFVINPSTKYNRFKRQLFSPENTANLTILEAKVLETLLTSNKRLSPPDWYKILYPNEEYIDIDDDDKRVYELLWRTRKKFLPFFSDGFSLPDEIKFPSVINIAENCLYDFFQRAIITDFNSKKQRLFLLGQANGRQSMLLEILINYPNQQISHKTIKEIIWRNDQSENDPNQTTLYVLKNRLVNTLRRIRPDLEKKFITDKKNNYMWSSGV
jgi:DNA-binding response OmpR family regulator